VHNEHDKKSFSEWYDWGKYAEDFFCVP
jgi:hypothetical protein